MDEAVEARTWERRARRSASGEEKEEDEEEEEVEGALPAAAVARLASPLMFPLLSPAEASTDAPFLLVGIAIHGLLAAERFGWEIGMAEEGVAGQGFGSDGDGESLVGSGTVKRIFARLFLS